MSNPLASVLLLLVGMTGPLLASDLPPLIERAPAVAAAEARLAAARARLGGAGAWTDPRFELEHMRSREDDGGREWELRATQGLPTWGRRDAERAHAAAEVDMAAAEAVLLRAELAGELGRLAAGVVAATAEVEIQNDLAERARVLEEALRAALASEGAIQVGDLLALRSRVDARELDALRARNEAADLAALAIARLGTDEIPVWSQWPRPDPALASVEHHPALRLAAARQRLAAAGGDLARSMGRPMVEVGVGWGTMRTDGMREDRVMGMLMVSLPVQRAPVRAGIAAAVAEGRAADAEAASLRFQAQAALDRAHRAAALAAEATARAARTVERLDADLVAATRRLGLDAQAGGGLTQVLDRLDQLAEAELIAIAAERAAAEAAADLWPLMPWKDLSP